MTVILTHPRRVPTDNQAGARNVLTHHEISLVEMITTSLYAELRDGMPRMILEQAARIMMTDPLAHQVIDHMFANEATHHGQVTVTGDEPDWLREIALDGATDDTWGDLSDGDPFHAYRVLNHVVHTDQAGFSYTWTWTTQRAAEISFLVSAAYQRHLMAGGN